MDKNDKKHLVRLLAIWFRETKLNKRNLFNKDEVARTIKSELKRHGYWKHVRRDKGNVKNLIKDKPSKENKSTVEEKLCECGQKMVMRKDKLVCSDYFCEK